MRKFYSNFLRQLGADYQSVNATRLKEQILKSNSNIEASSSKREVYLSYKDQLAAALEYSREYGIDNNAKHLSRAARILMNDMKEKKQKFTGYYTATSQTDSIPESLLSFINMLTGSKNDTDHQSNTDTINFVPALSIAQLIQFNSSEQRTTSTQFRKSANKETPLSVHLAFLLHAHSRSRTLIDKFYNLGLCISYDRMLSLSTSLGNSVCKQYEKDGLVCPQLLRKYVFTTHGMDNIDHNPSSRFATDSYHGTAITATQHKENPTDGLARPQILFQEMKGKRLQNLPSKYTSVKPYVLKDQDLFTPQRSLTADEQKVSTLFEFVFTNYIIPIFDALISLCFYTARKRETIFHDTAHTQKLKRDVKIKSANLLSNNLVGKLEGHLF